MDDIFRFDVDPSNWKGQDPCGSKWEGISCNASRVTTIMLAGMGVTGSSLGDITTLIEHQLLDLSNNIGLKGTLLSSIGDLKNLYVLILIGCSFFGPIPVSIGSLSKLVYSSLNSNRFNGSIPHSIGNLANLSWLDLSENQLNGTIPVSNETSRGLDMLLRARHIHLSKNQLSGIIQPQLFNSSMRLIHVIMDNNQLTGSIPPSLGLVQTFEVVRMDWNSIDGSVPSNLTNLTGLNELLFSNNNLIGAIPNLGGMNALAYIDISRDMSNNSFDTSTFSTWLTGIQSLTTLYPSLSLSICCIVHTFLLSLCIFLLLYMHGKQLNEVSDSTLVFLSKKIELFYSIMYLSIRTLI